MGAQVTLEHRDAKLASGQGTGARSRGKRGAHLARIIVVLLTALLAFAALPVQANAEIGPSRWAWHWVCVENHAHRYWHVRDAVERYDTGNPLRVRYRADCSGWRQIVRVYDSYEGRNGVVGRAGLAWTSDGFVSPMTIRMNKSYLREADGGWTPWKKRAHSASHELGHVLGIAHTDHPDSVMGPNPWVPYPTAYDHSELRRRYS